VEVNGAGAGRITIADRTAHTQDLRLTWGVSVNQCGTQGHRVSHTL
jgi:hypothetical protein